MGCICIQSQFSVQADNLLKSIYFVSTTKIIRENNKELIIDLKKNKLGEFFTNGIKNAYFLQKNDQIKRILNKVLKKYILTNNIEQIQKEELIRSVLQEGQTFNQLIYLMLNNGISNEFRWIIWSQVLSFNKQGQIDEQLLLKRKEIYRQIITLDDTVVVDIVQKDVLRTNRNFIYFQDRDSICSQELFNICKALGIFFNKIGYVQGMNFIVSFFLQLSAFEEFDTFNLIVNFWKKRKNLYFGIYDEGFVLIDFYQYFYLYGIKKFYPKQYNIIKKRETQNQIIFIKWIVSFFTLILTREYLLRVFDYLIVSDFSRIVIVMISLVSQVFDLFYENSFIKFSEAISTPEIFCQRLNYKELNKSLQQLHFSHEEKQTILNEYYQTLQGDKKDLFEFYYQHYQIYLKGEDDDYIQDFQLVLNYSKDLDNTVLLKQKVSKATQLIQQKNTIQNKEIEKTILESQNQYQQKFLIEILQFQMQMNLSDITNRQTIYREGLLEDVDHKTEQNSDSLPEISLNDELLFSHSQIKDISGLQLLDQQNESVEFLNKKVKYLLQINQALQLQLKNDHRKRQSLQNHSKKLVFQIEQLNTEIQNKNSQLQEMEQNMKRKILESHIEEEKLSQNESSLNVCNFNQTAQQRILEQNSKYKQKIGVIRFQYNQLEKQIEILNKENQDLKQKLNSQQAEYFNTQQQYEQENLKLRNRVSQLEKDFNKRLDDIQQLQQYQELITKNNPKNKKLINDLDQAEEDNESFTNQTFDLQTQQKPIMSDSLLSQNNSFEDSIVNSQQQKAVMNKDKNEFQNFSQLL